MRLLLLALAACDGSSFSLGLPSIDTDRAAVIAFSGTSIEAHAFEPGTGAKLETEIDLDAQGDEVTATVLFYSTALSSLGLTPGPIEEDPAGRPFPMFEEAFETKIDSGGAGDWSPIGELDPALAAFRIPSVSACKTFQPRTIDDVLALGDYGLSLVAVDDDRALFLTARNFSERQFYLVSREGTVIPFALDTGDFRPDALTRTRDGRIAMAGRGLDGTELWLGDPTGGFAKVSELESAFSSVSQIVPGSSEEPAGTIYAITTGADVIRFDEGASAEQLENEVSSGSTSLAVLGPNDVLFTTGNRILWHADGPAQEEPTAIDERLDMGDTRIWSIGARDGFAIAGTSTGEILERNDGRWSVVGTTILEVSARAILPFGDGLIAVGHYGLLQEYYPDSGLCPGLLLGRDYDIVGVVPAGDLLIAAGSRVLPDGERTPMIAIVEAE